MGMDCGFRCGASLFCPLLQDRGITGWFPLGKADRQANSYCTSLRLIQHGWPFGRAYHYAVYAGCY